MAEKRETPMLTVIVPAHQAAAMLPETLGALADSTLPRSEWELVVVDDASTDDTAGVAARFADRVVRLDGPPRGPAHARNRGVATSDSAAIVFVDADIVVHADALERFGAIMSEARYAAVFGAYDTRPRAPGIVSRYRNLLHHYHHRRGAGAAETFWAGLGAVRREVFVDLGGFDDARYREPKIEDIELGRRMRRAGHEILLDPAIQGTHLKRWTIASMVATDLNSRAIPWMRLILSEGGGGNTLNVRLGERLSVAGTGLFLAAAASAVLTLNWIAAATAAVLLLTVIGANIRFYRFLARVRGIPFAMASVPLHLLYFTVAGVAAVIGYGRHFTTRKTDRAGGDLADELVTPATSDQVTRGSRREL